MRAEDLLRTAGFAKEVLPPVSTSLFPDGAHFRLEVPSVEGPGVLTAILDEGQRRNVVVNRVSQGSGAMLQSEAEMREMATAGADAGIEVSLFVGPREEWGLSATARASDGGSLAGGVRGLRQLRFAVEDVLRAVDCGIRGFLVADLGLLRLLVRAQSADQIPAGVVWKVSAMAAPSNPATLMLLDELGAGSVNLPTDLTIAELAEMRAVTTVPLDLYVEASEAMGGVVRGEQVGELVRVCAPMYTKFGLRNSRSIYPSGMHLQTDAELMGREKVRRAQIAMEWLDRSGIELIQSKPGAVGLGIPQP